jgi:hypothetical protein
MVDDRKRENVVNVRFTDRELLDLSREAGRQDRKLAELIHFIVRAHLYGYVCIDAPCCEGAESVSGGRS